MEMTSATSSPKKASLTSIRPKGTRSAVVLLRQWPALVLSASRRNQKRRRSFDAKALLLIRKILGFSGCRQTVRFLPHGVWKTWSPGRVVCINPQQNSGTGSDIRDHNGSHELPEERYGSVAPRIPREASPDRRSRVDSKTWTRRSTGFRCSRGSLAGADETFCRKP